ERILDVEAHFDVAMGEQAAEERGVFAGDGDDWQRSSRVKAERGGVYHAVGLVGDDEHGRSAGFCQAAGDDGARAYVRCRAAVAAEVDDYSSAAHASGNRVAVAADRTEVGYRHFDGTRSAGHPTVRADDQGALDRANHFAGCGAMAPS